eukprot:scaffold248300_cov24-Tisochrysis_lutea.AAC.1
MQKGTSLLHCFVAHVQQGASSLGAEDEQMGCNNVEISGASGLGAEDAQMVVEAMAQTGNEATYCMGDDIPLAVLSDKPHPLYNYFKQRFAQVGCLLLSLCAPIGVNKECGLIMLSTYFLLLFLLWLLKTSLANTHACTYMFRQAGNTWVSSHLSSAREMCRTSPAKLGVDGDHSHEMCVMCVTYTCQVTNPPIDPLREGLVMSMEMRLGKRGNLLQPDTDSYRQPCLYGGVCLACESAEMEANQSCMGEHLELLHDCMGCGSACTVHLFPSLNAEGGGTDEQCKQSVTAQAVLFVLLSMCSSYWNEFELTDNGGTCSHWPGCHEFFPLYTSLPAVMRMWCRYSRLEQDYHSCITACHACRLSFEGGKEGGLASAISALCTQ